MVETWPHSKHGLDDLLLIILKENSLNSRKFQ